MADAPPNTNSVAIPVLRFDWPEAAADGRVFPGNGVCVLCEGRSIRLLVVSDASSPGMVEGVLVEPQAATEDGKQVTRGARVQVPSSAIVEIVRQVNLATDRKLIQDGVSRLVFEWDIQPDGSVALRDYAQQRVDRGKMGFGDWMAAQIRLIEAVTVLQQYNPDLMGGVEEGWVGRAKSGRL
ncbi:hypothetical protein RM531_08395 [Salinisphaera sp. P385]|uniref:Uncharacterized protein n=1 Tax=Spectribacter acetivorans TaxID=3075603 RepID=A0ABU3B8U6_9GAMM|nr:hypothetical protein [Salinisphaera sp. P385]MDT0618495.1 hypothetical protein [Salinisphaera sp. P385]